MQRGELVFSSQTLEELEQCAFGEALRVSLCRYILSDSPPPCLLINKTFSNRKAFAPRAVKQIKCVFAEKKTNQQNKTTKKYTV